MKRIVFALLLCFAAISAQAAIRAHKAAPVLHSIFDVNPVTVPTANLLPPVAPLPPRLAPNPGRHAFNQGRVLLFVGAGLTVAGIAMLMTANSGGGQGVIDDMFNEVLRAFSAIVLGGALTVLLLGLWRLRQGLSRMQHL